MSILKAAILLLCITCSQGVVPNWARREDFKQTALGLNIATTAGMPGDTFLFAASMGKRSGTFPLEKAAEIMDYMTVGLVQAEEIVVSRIVRGFTSSDYEDATAMLEINLTNGGVAQVPAAAYWSVLRRRAECDSGRHTRITAGHFCHRG